MLFCLDQKRPTHVIIATIQLAEKKTNYHFLCRDKYKYVSGRDNVSLTLGCKVQAYFEKRLSTE